MKLCSSGGDGPSRAIRSISWTQLNASSHRSNIVYRTFVLSLVNQFRLSVNVILSWLKNDCSFERAPVNVSGFSILMSFSSRAIGLSGGEIGVSVGRSGVLPSWLNRLSNSSQTWLWNSCYWSWFSMIWFCSWATIASNCSDSNGPSPVVSLGGPYWL
jgi:hypothetical protein